MWVDRAFFGWMGESHSAVDDGMLSGPTGKSDRDERRDDMATRLCRTPLAETLAFAVCSLVAASVLGACTGSSADSTAGKGSAPASDAARPDATPTVDAAPDASTAVIVAPVQNATVPQCAIVTGTSVLAPGKTLVSAMMNLDNGDPVRYYQPVRNWQVPPQLVNWTAKQYFGSGDSAVGQHFAVEIYSADLGVVTAAFANTKTSGEDWASPDPPAGAKMVARVEVKRIPGKGPDECN
jgi:hypothetical protein